MHLNRHCKLYHSFFLPLVQRDNSCGITSLVADDFCLSSWFVNPEAKPHYKEWPQRTLNLKYDRKKTHSHQQIQWKEHRLLCKLSPKTLRAKQERRQWIEAQESLIHGLLNVTVATSFNPLDLFAVSKNKNKNKKSWNAKTTIYRH